MFNKNDMGITKSKLVEKNTNLPNIRITLKAMAKMMHIVKNSSKEVGWLGSAVREENNIIIEDVYLLKQKVHSTTCELMPDAISEFFSDLKKEKGIEAWSKIKVWGHSHVDMPVIPSNQDDETFKDYYQDNEFFIRIICNKNSEMKLDLADKKNGYLYENLPFTILYPEQMKEFVDTVDELETRLKEKRKELEGTISEFVNKFEDTVKAELKEKVTEFFESKIPSKYNEINSYSYYDYYYDDWNYEDETEDIKIPYYNKKNKKKYTNIEEVLTQREIVEIAENCKKAKDLEKICNGIKAFKGYKENDWNELFYACWDYVLKGCE